MGYNLSVTIDLTLAPKIEDLKKQNRMSGLVNKLLTDYFDDQEKQRALENPVMISIRSEKDIKDYIVLLKFKSPNVTSKAIEMLENNLREDLKTGEFMINIQTGERQKAVKSKVNILKNPKVKK